MKFAEALEVIPRVLADNAGLDATEVVSKLYAAHQAGDIAAGVDVEVCHFNILCVFVRRCTTFNVTHD